MHDSNSHGSLTAKNQNQTPPTNTTHKVFKAHLNKYKINVGKFIT